MPIAKANGIEIAYETFGDKRGRPLILIMGLGSQMVSWPDPFCQRLAAVGHFVVRFDNRDAGLSTRLESAQVPQIGEILAAREQGLSLTPPYLLSDMAQDTVGLMDALQIDSAHICGLSMGGMIAQTIAIEHPERTRTLISMESTTGEAGLPPAAPEVAAALLQPPPMDREGFIRHMVEVFRLFAGGSPFYAPDVQKELSARTYERGFYPAGFARQFAAIVASGGRKERLAAVKAPTLVIHGTNDTIFSVEHAQDTAAAIAGARLVLIEGLGHGTAYPRLWKQIVGEIAAHTSATP